MKTKNNLLEEIKNWVPLSKMEDASEEVYADRIYKSMQVTLPNEDLVKIPYMGKKEVIEYITEELIALCPVTFLPDIYKITVRYIPNKYIPELKSLKYFFMDYAQLPISHEHLASKIFYEFAAQLNPEKLYIYLETNIRGGIITNIEIGEKI